MKLVVWKNDLGGQILYRSFVPIKNSVIVDLVENAIIVEQLDIAALSVKTILTEIVQPKCKKRF